MGVALLRMCLSRPDADLAATVRDAVRWYWIAVLIGLGFRVLIEALACTQRRYEAVASGRGGDMRKAAGNWWPRAVADDAAVLHWI